jgi:hypothetical protein
MTGTCIMTQKKTDSRVIQIIVLVMHGIFLKVLKNGVG